MEPFDGLFGSRAYHFAGAFRWDFRAPDLNDSAPPHKVTAHSGVSHLKQSPA